jgi:hypothetical protein
MEPPRTLWTEHPDNPLISPQPPGWMIADPTVLLPEETPDGRWHLFANSIPPRLWHYVSEDGIRWQRGAGLASGGMRPFVRRFDGRFHLFYEDVRWWLPLRSRIVHSVSDDLVSWSRPREVLRPSLPWHGELNRTCGNPCVVPWRGKYLLYYSAATVFLRDCGFVEPRYVGLATADSLDGPWKPDLRPLLEPSLRDPLRNLGAGSIKVIPAPDGSGLWGFNNGIYRDDEGRSRSAVAWLTSPDGREWVGLDEPPFLVPGGSAWTRALVYALDVRVRQDGSLWLYFNARDGWFKGKERIGLAVGTVESTA